MILLFVAGAARADEGVAAAISAFEVPSFSAQQLLLEGDQLLALEGDATGTEADGTLALTYTFSAQTPERSVVVGNRLAGYATTRTTHPLALAGEEVAAASVQQYFGNSRGPYVALAAAAGAAAVADDAPLGDAYGGAGLGYGRVVDARTVAQAAAMFRVLEREPSSAELSTVAELLGQRGAYALKYKYDADLHFYADLAVALGGADAAETFRVQQVLDSPLYNIGSRLVGWEAGARVDAGVGDAFETAPGGALTARAYVRAATVLGDTTSVLVAADLAQALFDRAQQTLTTPVGGLGEGNGELTVYASLDVDHSATWTSGLSAEVVPLVLVGGDPSEATARRWSATADTKLSVQKKLVVGLGAEAAQSFGADDLAWTAGVTLSYYLL